MVQPRFNMIILHLCVCKVPFATSEWSNYWWKRKGRRVRGRKNQQAFTLRDQERKFVDRFCNDRNTLCKRLCVSESKRDDYDSAYIFQQGHFYDASALPQTVRKSLCTLTHTYTYNSQWDLTVAQIRNDRAIKLKSKGYFLHFKWPTGSLSEARPFLH